MATRDGSRGSSKRRQTGTSTDAQDTQPKPDEVARAGSSTPKKPARTRKRRAGQAAPTVTSAAEAETGEAAAPAAPTPPATSDNAPEPTVPAEPQEPAAGAAAISGELPQEAEPAAERRRAARERPRIGRSNALGLLIEQQFSEPSSPCRSYSDLERRSGISREALSRYVTSRRDRRRSPTVDTLVAIADAMHLSLEATCRAAAASVRGVIPPPMEIQSAREEVLGSLVAALTEAQFSAVVELLQQMRPVHVEGGGEHTE